MINSDQNVVGLVELANAEQLQRRLGDSLFSAIQQAFFQRLEQWVGPDDEWSRLDDTRFCVVLRDLADPLELELATSELQRRFTEPHYHSGTPVSLDIHAGFAALSDPENELELALRQASAALRQARKLARTYHVFTPQTAAEAAGEEKLVADLESAVDLGELQLYYQPKVDARTQSLVGAEVLMRWHTSDNKVIPPSEFIAVAECHDVIRPMTLWAIKSTIARLANWPEALSISVNISPQLLRDGQLAVTITEALENYGVSPQRLILEVTERIMVDNRSEIQAQLVDLRERGIRISLDDFGTGYCSLAGLRDLPVDEIKIDTSFVMNMMESAEDHAIVKAAIDLAQNFSRQVVAEGVESMAIAERLKELGCHILQGYFFDKPMEVDRFEANYGLVSADPEGQSGHAIN